MFELVGSSRVTKFFLDFAKKSVTLLNSMVDKDINYIKYFLFYTLNVTFIV